MERFAREVMPHLRPVGVPAAKALGEAAVPS
jgi:hypothetical protein